MTTGKDKLLPDDIRALVEGKDQHELCREVLAIGDTMDVLRSKWTVEVLTAIVCGSTRFKEILASVHGLSDKVLAERLRAMQDDRLIAHCEYPTPPIPSPTMAAPSSHWPTACPPGAFSTAG